MSALTRVQEALRERGCKGDGRTFQCPAHVDRSPSLSVKAGDGRALVHCFAGCETADVIAVLGLTMGDLFDEPRVRAWSRLADGSLAKPRPKPRVKPAKQPRCRIGLPNDDDVFWAQPDAVIDAHFAALLEAEEAR